MVGSKAELKTGGSIIGMMPPKWLHVFSQWEHPGPSAGDFFQHVLGKLEDWGLAEEVPPQCILDAVKVNHLASSSAYHGMQPHNDKGSIFFTSAHFTTTAAVVVLSWPNLYPTVVPRRLPVLILICSTR